MKALLTAMFLLLLPAIARAAEMIEVEPGVSLYAERIGDGPKVVIIPGGFLYDASIARLAGPDRTLILYDMRNRGRSSPVTRDDQISIEADVADIEAVRRHYSAERVSLIGYSYLGLVTMVYAAEHPDRIDRVVQFGPVAMRWDTEFPMDLVWTDPAPVMPPDELAAVERARDEGMIRTDPKEYCLRVERLTRLRLVADPRNAERIDYRRRCEMENEWPVNFERHIELHFVGSVQNYQAPRDAIRALDTPVLTIHGTMDRNAPFASGAEWATLLRNGRLVIVPRAAHPVWVEHEAIWDAVGRFLDGEWPASAIIVRSYDEVRARLPNGLGGR